MRRSWLAGALGVVTLIAAAAASAANTFPDVIPLPTGWRPEGIEAGRQHTLYVGSIPTGAVRQIDARTGESFTLVQPTAGRAATGLEYDRKDERLFVSGGGTGAAYVYDAETGEPIADYVLTPDAPRFINDNVLTKDAVYFTDSRRPWLYRLPLGHHGELPAASDVQTIPLSGDYVHDPTVGVNNLNGIVATPNGKTLIAVQSNTASLLQDRPQHWRRRHDRAHGRRRDERRRATARGPNALRRPELPQPGGGHPPRARPRLGDGRRPPVTSGVQSADHDRQGERAPVPAERSLRGAHPGTQAYEVVSLG